jgi:hypothetical protein
VTEITNLVKSVQAIATGQPVADNYEGVEAGSSSESESSSGT